MLGTPQARRQALALSRRLLFGIVAAYFLVLAGLVTTTLIRKAQTVAAKSQIKQNSAARSEIERTLQHSGERPKGKAPVDLQAVARFQSSVEGFAKKHGCAISEFRASSEAMPYLSRFSTTTNVKNWSQVEVQMAISGRARRLIALLSDLRTQELPFEFNSLDLTRSDADRAGDAIVTAQVGVRVLVRSPGGGA